MMDFPLPVYLCPRCGGGRGEGVGLDPGGGQRQRGAAPREIIGVCRHGAAGVHSDAPPAPAKRTHQRLAQPPAVPAPQPLRGQHSSGGRHRRHTGRAARPLLSSRLGTPPPTHTDTPPSLCLCLTIWCSADVRTHILICCHTHWSALGHYLWRDSHDLMYTVC